MTRRYLALTVIAASLLALTSCSAEKKPDLDTVTVKKGSILASIPSEGTVMPRNRLEIKPPVAGRIESVLVKEGQEVSKGQVLAWMSSQERATLIDAARSKGADEVRKWEEIYKPSPIIAPINGSVIQCRIEPGQSFTINDPVIVMADFLIVQANVDETDIGKISNGQPVTINIDAYPDRPVPGKVSHIAYESSTINNVTVYQVDIRPDRAPAFLRSGMSASVKFMQERKDGVLLLPSNAVKKRGKTTYAFVMKEGASKPSAVQVETGLEDDANIEIVSGLTEGQPAVIPSASLLRELMPGRMGPPNVNPFQRRSGS